MRLTFPFTAAIERAKKACEQSGNAVSDHFAGSRIMIETGKGARREIDDYHLTRYACYLIAQNADPSKEIVAQAQTYFAVQTRRQELDDEEAAFLAWREHVIASYCELRLLGRLGNSASGWHCHPQKTDT